MLDCLLIRSGAAAPTAPVHPPPPRCVSLPLRAALRRQPATMSLEKVQDHLQTGASLETEAGEAAPSATDIEMIAQLSSAAKTHGLDIAGGKVRRTSSRFCLGVEHGDYNGTELFGVGTDRFIWLACAPPLSPAQTCMSLIS